MAAAPWTNVYTHVPRPPISVSMLALAGKVIVGLASHWPCVTDSSAISTYRLTALERKTSTTPTLQWSMAHFTVTFYVVHRIKIWTVLCLQQWAEEVGCLCRQPSGRVGLGCCLLEYEEANGQIADD